MDLVSDVPAGSVNVSADGGRASAGTVGTDHTYVSRGHLLRGRPVELSLRPARQRAVHVAGDVAGAAVRICHRDVRSASAGGRMAQRSARTGGLAGGAGAAGLGPPVDRNG